MSGTHGIDDTHGAHAASHSEFAPEPYLPRPGFEHDVATAFNRMFERLNLIPREVSEAVIGSLNSVRDQPSSQVTPSSHPQALQIDIRQVQDLQAQIDDLKAKNESLVDRTSSLEKVNEQLKADNNKKINETRRLHEVIIQSGQKDGEISDQAIVQRFDGLYHQIMTTVQRHYTGQAVKYHKDSKLKRMTGDDRAFYLRSLVANILHKRLFDPEAYFFGFDQPLEKNAQDLEKRLRGQRDAVPEAEISEWRVATVKIAMRLDSDARNKRVNDLVDSIADSVEAHCRIPAPKASDVDLYNLCASAYDIALMLRRCKALYDWQQREPPAKIEIRDVELTGPYDTVENGGPLYPVRILFGPLYKGLGNERVLLRQGDVLEGSRVGTD